MAQGAMTADDTIAQWKHYPSMFEQLDMPAQRFVRLGGDPAKDFIQRIMDLIMIPPPSATDPAAEALGLPQYVVVDVLEVLAKSKQRPRKSGKRVVAPKVTLDPMAISGPQLLLPALSEEFDYPTWRVTADGASSTSLDGSSLSSETVSLEPARSWEVTLRDAEGGVTTWPIAGLSDESAGVLFFDPKTFELLRNQQVIRTDSVIALCGGDVTLAAKTANGEQTPRVIQENPAMPGPWSSYSRNWIDLDGVTSLLIGTGQQLSTTVFIKARELPSLEGRPVDGVTLPDGGAVFGKYPVIQLPNFDPSHRGMWRIAVVQDDKPPVLLSDENAHDDGTFHFKDHFDKPGAVLDVNVRGSLGTDFRERFAVVEGLRFDRPMHIVAPDEDCTTTLIQESKGTSRTIAEPVFSGTARDLSCTLTFVDLENRTLDIRLEIPRLAWGVSQTGKKLELGARPVRVSTSDLMLDHDMTLVISTGLADAYVSLALTQRDGGALGHEISAKTTGEGRWNFPLGQFLDSISASDESVSHLTLECQGLTSTAVIVSSIYEVQLHEATAEFDDDGAVVSISVRENQAFRDRHVLLWSTDRPWEDPRWARIPDSQKDDLAAAVPGLRPGHYRLQLSLDDPDWHQPQRPTHATALNWTVRLGEESEIEDWLTTPRGEFSSTNLELFLADLLDEATLLGSNHVSTDPDHVAAALGDIACRSRSAIANSKHTTPLLELAARDAPAFWDALGRRSMEYKADALLPLSLLALPLALDPVSASTVSSARSELWDKLPAIGAALDLASSSDDAHDRCIRRLEWHPRTASCLPTAFGKPEPQLLKMSAEALSAFREQVTTNSIEPRYFRMSEYQIPANFEWLEAAAADPSEIVAWVRKAYVKEPALEQLDGERYGHAMEYLRERLTPGQGPHTAEGAIALTPFVTLGKAFELVLSPDAHTTARRHLIQAAAFAPRLVIHDIMLALAVAHFSEGAQE
jgi:hypothetical protein